MKIIAYISTFFFILIVSKFSKSMERCRHYNHQRSDKSNCTNNSICNKTFNISYITIQPYSPTNGIENYVHLCCEPCSRTNVINTFKDSESVTPELISTSHFVYPVLGSVSDESVNGYYFIPVIHAPRTYYLTLKPERTVLYSLFQLYPLMTVCFFMGILAGFICWVIECRKSGELSIFSHSFLIGWFEGIWWAFVSMSTVGYGDVAPKTVAGRIFSMFWILLGTTAMAVLTAMLTAVLTESNSHKEPDIYGAKVGVLQGRLYDALVVADHGGIMQPSVGTDFESSVYELIMKLHNRTIDGILLDSYTLLYVDKALHFREKDNMEQKKLKERIQIYLRNTMKTCIIYDNEVLAYGMLVKYEEDYEYFRDVIRGNRLHLQKKLDESSNEVINNSFKLHLPDLFAPDKIYFQRSATFLFTTNGLILLVGCLYGFAKWKKLNTKIKLLNNFDKFMV